MRFSTLQVFQNLQMADISEDREKIEKFVSASERFSFAKRRRIVREALLTKVDQGMPWWFMQQRSKGAPISGPILQEKALQFFPQFYPDAEKDAFN